MRNSLTKDAWSLRVIYQALFRFKWRAIGFFVITVALAVVGIITSPRAYESYAKLLLRIGRESVSVDPTATASGQVIGFESSREIEINSVLEMITSRQIAEKVVDRLHQGKPFASAMERDIAIRDLRDRVSAWSPKQTSVIVLGAEGPTPEAAQEITQAIVDVYREEHMRVHRTSGSYKFFQEQSQMLRQQLEEATEQLRDAKNRFGFVDLAARRESLQKQVGELETTMRNLDSEITGTAAQASAVRASLDGLPSNLVATLAGGNEAVVKLREQFFALQTREQELLAKFTERHPEVIAIRQQVRELREIFDNEKIDRGVAQSTVVLKEESLLSALQARRAKVAEQQQQLQAELQSLNQQESEVNQLQREVDLLAANYKTYAHSFEQSRVDQALSLEGITNVSVVQPASFEPKATRPRKGLTLAIAMFIGLCGGVTIALLSEQLDQTLRTSDDVERHLRLPILTSIPEMKAHAASAL